MWWWLRNDNKPVSFSQAMERDDFTKWINAIGGVVKCTDQNQVWDLVEFPKESKNVGCISTGKLVDNHFLADCGLGIW